MGACYVDMIYLGLGYPHHGSRRALGSPMQGTANEADSSTGRNEIESICEYW